MWTHFSFYIYVEYEFRNFEHYFNVFWSKKTTIWKKHKRKCSDSNNKKMSIESKMDFFWTDDKIQVLLLSALHLFSSLYIFVVIVVGLHHIIPIWRNSMNAWIALNKFIKIVTLSSPLYTFSLLSRNLLHINKILCLHLKNKSLHWRYCFLMYHLEKYSISTAIP